MSNYDAAVAYFARQSGNASEMVLYIRSLAGYTTDTHEPSFLNDNVVEDALPHEQTSLRPFRAWRVNKPVRSP